MSSSEFIDENMASPLGEMITRIQDNLNYEFSATDENSVKMEEDFLGTAVTVELNTADERRYVLQHELNQHNDRRYNAEERQDS